MKVRKVTRKTKQAADYTFVKAYHGKTFTKETYEIEKVEKRGDNYLYQLKDGTNKFYRRDRISENTPAADPESNDRVKSNRKNIAPPTPPPSPKGVKTRAAKKKEQAAEAKDKLEEKESEVKKPDKKEKPKPPDSNVIEEHEKAVLKKAPHFNSKVRYHQMNKWLKYTVPATQRLQRKEWMSRDDLKYIEEKLKHLGAFLDHMEKNMKDDKKWMQWIEKRREDLEDVDEALNQVNSAEGDNHKPTWKVEKRQDLKAHKIGKPAEKIYYPKGSPYAI